MPKRRKERLRRSHVEELDKLTLDAGLSYSQIAKEINKSEQHVIDSRSCPGIPSRNLTERWFTVCTGKVTPTAEEFKNLAKVLDITDSVRNPVKKRNGRAYLSIFTAPT